MTDPGVVQRVAVSVPAAPPGAAAGSAVASTTKPGELAVRETARQLAAASISDNTQRAYAGAMRRLGEHLEGAELTDAMLADYLAHLFEIGRSPASAAMVVAAVRFQVRVTGSDSPVDAATDRVLAGFRRAGSDRGRGQVAGVRWGQADAAAAVAGNGGESIHGLRDAAILAVASDAMLRVSELAALRVGDIGAGEDNAATVTVRHSKTDQEGEGAVFSGIYRPPLAAYRGLQPGQWGQAPNTEAHRGHEVDRPRRPTGEDPRSVPRLRHYPNNAPLARYRWRHRHEVADSLDAIARSLEGSDQGCFRVAALVARCFIEKTPQCRVGGRRDEHPASRDGRLVHAPQRIYVRRRDVR